MNPDGQLNPEERERLAMAEEILTNSEDPILFAVKKNYSEKHARIEVFFGNGVSHEEATEFLDELQNFIDSKFQK